VPWTLGKARWTPEGRQKVVVGGIHEERTSLQVRLEFS